MKFFSLFIFTVVFTAAAFAGGRQELPVFAYQDRVGDASAILAAHSLELSGSFEVKRFSSGNMCAEALVSGTADFATMGDAVAVQLASRFPDSIVILGIHGEGAGRHRLVYTKEPPAVIGVKFGTSTHAALQLWLATRGPGYAGTRLIDMSLSTQIAALASGEIDALAASEPTPSLALEKVEGVQAASLGTAGRNFPVLLVGSRKSLEKYPDAAALLESALYRGAVDITENTPYLSSVTGLSEDVLEKSLKLHSFGWRPLSEYINELNDLAAFLMEQGSIDQLPDWTRVEP